MAGIIWFVVVMYIVIRCVSASKKNSRQTKPNVPRQQAQTNRRGGVQSSPSHQSQTGGWGSTANTARNASQQRNTRTAQQSGRTGSQASQQKRSGGQRPPQENSILQKAKANASQQFDDDTLVARGSADLNRVPLGDEIMKDQAKTHHIHSEHEADHQAELCNQLGVDDFDTYHLIDEVNDLIVKGYSGNLEFQRDFLSEATDMLNRMYG
ncbi:MAG: hypothetical protein SPG09_00120 [Lachnospiraceae bacterium]|nr:hypothetical protein [bacterium]MDY5516014.1 hypothetical protein [Lachnospiraceae bacterium]